MQEKDNAETQRNRGEYWLIEGFIVQIARDGADSSLVRHDPCVGQDVGGRKNGGAACGALLRHSVQLRGKLIAETEGYGDV
jgi:hypothetical protein